MDLRLASIALLCLVLVACSNGAEPDPDASSAQLAVVTETTTTSTTPPAAETSIAEGEQLEGERLWALTPGNDPNAARINIV